MEQSLKTLLGEAIEPYDNETIKPGVICSTTVPYVPPKCNVIEPLSYNTASPQSKQYQFLSMEYTQVRKYLVGKKAPHFELGTRSDEIVLAYITKLRPVVILTPCLTGELSGFPAHFRNCVLYAPLYTIVDEEGNIKKGYNPQAVKGIVTLKYRSAFPIPTSPFLKSRICTLILDRIQPVQICALSCLHLKIRNKWLAYIREWTRFYATGRLAERKTPEKKETVAEYLDGVIEVLSDI